MLSVLKYPGRVGQASMFGCGCWVDEKENKQETGVAHSIALCTTGTGEDIIKTLFAKECADHILRNTADTQYSLVEFFDKHFFKSPMLANQPNKLVGTMICKLETSKDEKSCKNKTLSDIFIFVFINFLFSGPPCGTYYGKRIYKLKSY